MCQWRTSVRNTWERSTVFTWRLFSPTESSIHYRLIIFGAFKRSYFCTDSKSTIYYRNHQYFVFPKDFDLSGNELTHLNKRMRIKTTMCLWETDTDWPQCPLTKPNNVILSDVSGADRKWSQLYCSDYDIWHKLVSKCCKRQRLTVQNSVQKLRPVQRSSWDE